MKVILTIILLLTLSCDDNKHLSVEIRSLANDIGFPYSDILKKAKSGNEVSIKTMIRFFEKTDAGSSFSHSVYMYEILKSVGDKRFYKVLSKQDKKTIKWNLDWLQDRNRNLYTDYPELEKLKE